MKSSKKFIFICIIILLGIAACSGPEQAPASEGAIPTKPAEEEPAAPTAEAPTEPPPAPTPTIPPPPTVPPTPEAEPFYTDDFSDTESGWERYNEFDGVLDYEDGSYRMWIADVNTFFVWIEDQPNDVRIEVDAKKNAGPDNNQFGLLCRLDTGGTWEYYMFLITSEGKYGIAKSSRAEGTVMLGVAEMTPSDAIKVGDEVNHIRADCVGDTLTLYVNGQKLVEAQDNSLPVGDVGLVAGSAEESGADILFDDFRLYVP